MRLARPALVVLCVHLISGLLMGSPAAVFLLESPIIVLNNAA
jgi:hypothetical protein